jgi:glucuronate isomerase
MKNFMDADFLLETETARALYHNCAENQPIYDYHCHLPPAHIAENKRFADLTELWLAGDHYKWRMMRAMGFDEYFITGGAEPYEKFSAWAQTLEKLIGNPLYHWSHLELQRCFGINEPLCGKTAPMVWEKANAVISGGDFSVKDIFEKWNVYAVGTTDDPIDSLEFHRAVREGNAPIGGIKTKVIPSFRPDKVLSIEKAGFSDYIKKLGESAGIAIGSFSDLLAALEKRLDFFASMDCRASDHDLAYIPFVPADVLEKNKIKIEKQFQAALLGEKAEKAEKIEKKDADAYKTTLLVELARMYAERGLVMQLHIAAIRNVNSRALESLGLNTGYDAVHDRPMSENLAGLLDLMEKGKNLPKTILYSLNPKDYYPLATIMGGFQDNCAKTEKRAGVKGKIQLGSAWWFCDHRDGMEEQLRVLADLGLLSAFAGMLTDSRSFISYPRHEYFRRVLCNLIGKWVENGEYPADWDILSSIVKDVCFENAKRYFDD